MTKKQVKTEKKTNGTKIAIIASVCAAIVLVIVLIVLSMTVWAPKAKNGKGSGSTEVAKKDETSNKSVNTAGLDVAKIIAPSEENGGIGDHVRGNADSDVVLVEYADLQCPGCANMMSVLDGIYESYKDKVAFVFRHYPLSGHYLAIPAAKAVEAAGQQGYYWDALSYLFSARKDWVSSSDESVAVSLLEARYSEMGDFDVAKFRAAMSSDEVSQKISFDRSVGDGINVTETPSLYVNGEKVDFSSAKNFSRVREIVVEALESHLK